MFEDCFRLRVVVVVRQLGILLGWRLQFSWGVVGFRMGIGRLVVCSDVLFELVYLEVLVYYVEIYFLLNWVLFWVFFMIRVFWVRDFQVLFWDLDIRKEIELEVFRRFFGLILEDVVYKIYFRLLWEFKWVEVIISNFFLGRLVCNKKFV